MAPEQKNKGGRPYLAKGEKTVLIGYKDTEAHRDKLTAARERLGLDTNSALIRLIVNRWISELEKTL